MALILSWLLVLIIGMADGVDLGMVIGIDYCVTLLVSIVLVGVLPSCDPELKLFG